MTDSERNKRFIDSVDTEVRDLILANIANHYSISMGDAYLEILQPDAEAVFEYMKGNQAHVVLQMMINFEAEQSRLLTDATPRHY